MMTTHTSMRAGTGTATGIGSQPGSPGAAAVAARGGDFLATLAAALSIEVASTARPDGMPADLTAGDSDRPDAIDALIAALAPIIPTPQEPQQPGAAAQGDATDGASVVAPSMPAPARTAGVSLAQLADSLHEAAGAAVDGGSADDAGNQPAAREMPAQLLHTLAGPVREVAPEFRLAGSTELITGTAAQSLASASLNAQGTSTAAAGEQVLRTVVGSPRWAEELGSRLVLMTSRGQQEGSLTLSPEHLGPLEVRISVHQNTAQVWFGAQHADTRAALAEALPRLREMFAEAGMALGHAGVSQEAPRRQVPEVIDAAAGDQMEGDSASAPLEVGAHSISSALLDLYA
jgi:flagellar hook-length control protein FliK